MEAALDSAVSAVLVAAGPFESASGSTKALVFSAWNVVPDAIAALCSYEAQRRAVAALGREIAHSELYDRLKPLLRFARDPVAVFVGMLAALLLQYPSPTLASVVDPVEELVRWRDLQTLDQVLGAVTDGIQALIAPFCASAPQEGAHDERWYWAAPAMLDGQAFPGTAPWATADDGWRGGSADADEDPGASYKEHVISTTRQSPERWTPHSAARRRISPTSWPNSPLQDLPCAQVVPCAA